jgi:DNA invertase Pin-like site-specific DNA recombinase
VNVVSYLRVSGKSQVEGDGFERQAKAISAFCKTHSLRLCSEYQEKGVSGTVDGMCRPTFSQIIVDAENPNNDPYPIHAIVVERLDRLARDLMVSEVLLAECRKRGIQVFSADQGALINMAENGGDPTRVLVRQIMGALAQWEKTMLVRKLRSAKDRLKAAGQLCEGTKPYGSLPGERPFLNQILEWSYQGKNFSEIARVMNSMGAVNRSGRPFKPQNVRMIITNHNNKQKAKS